ncbi:MULTISPECIES: acyl-CoA carboxylase subunit epsilon [Nocardioides]|uniref:acyl-CoA carboxylase subunit epsilon n=1 Tax=Nocardioides TaxID=1839 RepID=UPI001A1B6CBB|nr:MULTISPECIES: acyl-CoA carboxylase subunit epsilon [Nocardioides]MBJ7531032.1 acyl-CoA carboxylase subunit epsilon [Nocardioides sp.]MCM3515881.1 acyl-CoA carboxylase subunit epsilon [Nocardioides sp. P86]
MSAEQEPAAPVLRVVTPDATPEEIAALVAVVSALGAGSEPAQAPRRPEWSAPARLVRRNPPHGPGGWRASALPR